MSEEMKTRTRARTRRPAAARRIEPLPRPERDRDRTPPRGAETEPRLGPYEFRYPVDLGYPSPVLD